MWPLSNGRPLGAEPRTSRTTLPGLYPVGFHAAGAAHCGKSASESWNESSMLLLHLEAIEMCGGLCDCFVGLDYMDIACFI